MSAQSGILKRTGCRISIAIDSRHGLPFKDGEVVLVCDHIWKDNGTKRLPVEWRPAPKATYGREDGTTGTVDYVAACKQCVRRDRKDGEDPTLYVETFWHDGRLHISDFHGSTA